MTYRWVNGWEATEEEWKRFDDLIVSLGWMRLVKEVTKIRVAEHRGEIAGLYVLQMIPHAEPMYVYKKYRGTSLADKLADDMLKYLTEENARGWFIIPENRFSEKMCQERGMVKVENPVYVMIGK